MLNILLHFTGLESKLKEYSKKENSPNFSFVKLERMDNIYSLFVKSREDFKKIRKLAKRRADTSIIGGWTKDGKKITFPNSEDDFTRVKFRQKMKRKIYRDENGDITEDREYTDQELQKGVINEIYGWNKREI